MENTITSLTKETDYLIIGAGAMGVVFADEILIFVVGLLITKVKKLQINLIFQKK